MLPGCGHLICRRRREIDEKSRLEMTDRNRKKGTALPCE